MRDWGISVLLTGLLATTTGLAQDAGAMVVIVKGDKTFHQPGCVVVAKAGSNVTVSKRGEATRPLPPPRTLADGTSNRP